MDLKTAVRRNRRRLATPMFLEKLSSVLGVSIEESALASIEETDELSSLIRTGYQTSISPEAASYRRFFREPQRDVVFRFADRLSLVIPDETAFFVPKQSHDCGAVRVKLALLLSHVASVISFDGDSLPALSEDRQQGLLIDQNAGDKEQAYEIAVWGDRWPLLAINCERSP